MELSNLVRRYPKRASLFNVGNTYEGEGQIGIKVCVFHLSIFTSIYSSVQAQTNIETIFFLLLLFFYFFLFTSFISASKNNQFKN